MELEKPIKAGAGALSKITNSSIFLGTLYGIVFLFSLPIYLSQGYELTDTFTMALYMVLIVVLVHIATNGLYYLVVIIPAVMAAVFFSIGAALWLSAPILGILLGTLSDILITFGGSLTNITTYSVDLITRIGQAYIAIAGAMWWLVSKAKDINYKALYIYIIFLAFVSIGTGLYAPSFGMLMLLLWATLSFKVKDDSDHGDNLKKVIKIASQATVIVSTYKTIDLSTDAWHGTSISLIILSAFFFITSTYCIWQPKFITKLIPETVKVKWDGFLIVIRFEEIKQAYTNMFFIKGERR